MHDFKFKVELMGLRLGSSHSRKVDVDYGVRVLGCYGLVSSHSRKVGAAYGVRVLGIGFITFPEG